MLFHPVVVVFAELVDLHLGLYILAPAIQRGPSDEL